MNVTADRTGKKRSLNYGIKAYGRWDCFKTKEKFAAYLMEWMECTDGCERERALDAFLNLNRGIPFTNTDGGGL